MSREDEMSRRILSSMSFTEKVGELLREFNALKKELFGDNLFVELDDSDPRTARYDQLLGYFFPRFRSSGWKNPLEVLDG